MLSIICNVYISPVSSVLRSALFIVVVLFSSGFPNYYIKLFPGSITLQSVYMHQHITNTLLMFIYILVLCLNKLWIYLNGKVCYNNLINQLVEKKQNKKQTILESKLDQTSQNFIL